MGRAIVITSGKGGVVVRGVAEISETNKGRHQIIITEIPYALNKASLIEKIAELVKDKKLTGISDIRDESSRGDVRIVIDLKKDAYPKKLLNQLYKMTQLQTTFHYNMLALIDGIQPRVLGVQDIISEYVKHRQAVVRRRTEFELRKAKDRAHILEGLKIALDHIDEVIAVIQTGQYAEHVSAAIEENRAELDALIVELIREDQAAGRLKFVPFHDDIVRLVERAQEAMSAAGQCGGQRTFLHTGQWTVALGTEECVS